QQGDDAAVDDALPALVAGGDLEVGHRDLALGQEGHPQALLVEWPAAEAPPLEFHLHAGALIISTRRISPSPSSTCRWRKPSPLSSSPSTARTSSTPSAST